MKRYSITGASSDLSGLCGTLVRQAECDIGDHVLLSPDEPASAQLDDDGPGVYAVAFRRCLSVPQERAVYAGVAESEGLAVDADPAVLSRPDEIIRRVLEREQVTLPVLE